MKCCAVVEKYVASAVLPHRRPNSYVRNDVMYVKVYRPCRAWAIRGKFLCKSHGGKRTI